MGPTQRRIPVVVSAVDVLPEAWAHNPTRTEMGGMGSAITGLSSVPDERRS